MRSSRPVSRSWARWLAAVLAAWTTTALVLVHDILPGADILDALVCGFWLCLGWSSAGGVRARNIVRRAMAFVLVLALPLQGIAAAAVEARGPAHIHAVGSPHSHADVERHHHAPADEAIAVEDGSTREAALASEENKRSAFDAAAPVSCDTAPPLRASAIQAGLFVEPMPHIPAPHERPPRA